MSRRRATDPERLLGKLGVKEALTLKYGFDILDLHLRTESEDIEDMKLRCFRHIMLLEGGAEALVLRKHRDMFIHQVLKAGLGEASNAINIIFEVVEYNKSLNRFIVYIRTPCNYLNQKIPTMHSLDIAWGKNEVNNTVNFFWSHRGENHMFSVTKDNTIAVMKAPNIVLGCNDKGELVLVNKDDLQRRLVFKDLFKSLSWRVEHRLSTSPRKDLASLKKAGFMTDWMEPGSGERRQAGREVCLEIMGRIIHEVLNFDGHKLVAGDPYFCSRIDRASKHGVELIERKENGYDITFTFSSDTFERCSIRLNTKSKSIQYIASQFYEANMEISWPKNLMFDITKDKPRNTHFIHHVLFIDFICEADTAKDDPTLPVFLEEVIPEEKDIQYIRNFNQQYNTRFAEKAYFVKWIEKVEHAFDVQDGKLVDNQQILLFYQHRGKNQQFCLEQNQQTLHPLGKFELAWGCRDESLKLVPRNSDEMIRFSNLSLFLNKQRNLDAGRMQEIAAMSRCGTEWESPLVIAYGLFSAITETVLTMK